MERIKLYKLTYLSFIAPALLIFTLFMVVPTLQTLILSFYKWDGASEKVFIGIDNFRSLFQDADLWLPIRNSLLWIADSVFIVLPLSFLFALLLNKNAKGSTFFRLVIYLPSILSEMAIGIIWIFIFNTNSGLLNTLLQSIHLDFLIKGWLYDDHVAIYSSLLANTWAYAGSYMLIYLAAMKNISAEIYEAAELDGAVGLRKILYITFPLLLDTIKTTVFLSIGASIQQFGLIFGLTGGGPGNSTQTLGTYIYKVAYQDYFFGYASSVAVLIFVISYGLIYVSNKVLKSSENYS
jgi:raffinose/stachyose/melibiose transport system permease protein